VPHGRKLLLFQMKNLQHNNVCSFIGACTEMTQIILVNEFCSQGALMVYLFHNSYIQVGTFLPLIGFTILPLIGLTFFQLGKDSERVV